MILKRKRLYPLLFALFLFFSSALPLMAAGEGNIDGGGGAMEGGTDTDVWRNLDGVRITVVTSEGTVISTPFDLSNASLSDNYLHFGKACKLQYTAGKELSISMDSYSYSKPGTPLPTIVSGGLNNTIEAVRRYFCSEYAAELVANKTGMAFEELINGNYKLVIEPIAYFTHGGRNYAMTATEAALYNIKANGGLRRKMVSLTHQNLPLALFLEVSDLGYPAWTGSSTTIVSDNDILSALGIGIISYRDVPAEDFQAPDYTYRVDTDVITSITLTTGTEVNPDNPASVTFHINGADYTINNIVIPKNSSQLVWVKWHTPSEPVSVPISVSVHGAHTAKTDFMARIISLEENPPPDPLATDTYPHYSIPALPNEPADRAHAWSVWSASWHPYWVWHSDWQWEEDWEWESDWDYISEGHDEYCPPYCPDPHLKLVDNGDWVDNGEWVDHGAYEDEGWFDYHATSYHAALTGTMEIVPDDIVPTAEGDIMKSGYGIKETAYASLSTNAPLSHYSSSQTAISYFPEFHYESYWRLLQASGERDTMFTFKPNEYSTYGRQVHFTPIWFPDTSYTVYTYVLDAWTPIGMLSVNLYDDVQIQGSMYDDWYTKRE